MKPEWTQDADGRSNSSAAFIRLSMLIEQRLRHLQLGDDLNVAARGLLAWLAHDQGLSPKGER